MTTAETQLAALFARYEPAIAKLGTALRKKLRARLPGLCEVVYLYANQHSLVIAYSPSGRGYDAVCSLALYPEQVKLFFTGGPALSKADPSGLLQGRGKLVRFVVMNGAADLDRPEIEALMVAAVGLAKEQLAPGTAGSVIFRVEEQKQRAARAKKAARPTSRRPAKSRR